MFYTHWTVEINKLNFQTFVFERPLDLTPNFFFYKNSMSIPKRSLTIIWPIFILEWQV